MLSLGIRPSQACSRRPEMTTEFECTFCSGRSDFNIPASPPSPSFFSRSSSPHYPSPSRARARDDITDPNRPKMDAIRSISKACRQHERLSPLRNFFFSLPPFQFSPSRASSNVVHVRVPSIHATHRDIFYTNRTTQHLGMGVRRDGTKSDRSISLVHIILFLFPYFFDHPWEDGFSASLRVNRASRHLPNYYHYHHHHHHHRGSSGKHTFLKKRKRWTDLQPLLRHINDESTCGLYSYGTVETLCLSS